MLIVCSICPATSTPPDRFEFRLLNRQSVETVHTHHVHVSAEAGKIEANDDDQISKHEDAPLEVITLFLVSAPPRTQKRGRSRFTFPSPHI